MYFFNLFQTYNPTSKLDIFMQAKKFALFLTYLLWLRDAKLSASYLPTVYKYEQNNNHMMCKKTPQHNLYKTVDTLRKHQFLYENLNTQFELINKQ